MTEQWLLLKRGLYWRPDDLGYTGIRDHAGRYSLDEAKARVGDGSSGVTMIKEGEAPEFTSACFDDLAREHLKKQIDDARAKIARMAELLKLISRTDSRHEVFDCPSGGAIRIELQSILAV